MTDSNKYSLSIVIAAKNEAHNIAECVASASFADEVLVLDSGSTDETVTIARAAGATVVQTDWPGYGPQQARAFKFAKQNWVLSLDADERITPELRAEVLAAIRSDAAQGYWLPRLSQFCGQFIHHSGWRPDYTLRLGRRELSSFTDHYLHAHMTVAGSTLKLKNHLIHYSYPNVGTLLEKLDRYSTGSAIDMHTAGRSGGLLKAITHGLAAFVRTYVLRAGFLDGKMGVILAIYNAEYAYYKYIKLMMMQSQPTETSASKTPN